MSALRSTADLGWRIMLAGLAHAAGIVLGGALTRSIGIAMPRPVVEIEPSRQVLLLLLGSIVLASGLAAMAVGLRGGLGRRWAVLAGFAFVVNGVSIGLETRIFTSLGGDLGMVLATLPASLLCGLAVSRLVPPPLAETPSPPPLRPLGAWSTGALAGRLVLAILAFPIVYLAFGAMVAPVVNPYYARLSFLTLPPLSTILSTQLVRSTLFLVVSLPIVAGWSGSRARLALALALGHFTAVGLNGLIQTPLFPAPMAWAHGFEILGDSVAYAFALTWLFRPPTQPHAREPRPFGRRAVEIARWLRVLAALACFVAIGSWPFLYYQLLRWLVCSVSLLGAVSAHRQGLAGWSLTLLALAFVFNPLFPMPFGQGLWMAADGIAGAVLLASYRMPDRP